MLRFKLVPVAAGLLALAAIPALGLFPSNDAEAQGAPPTIGMVIYGDAPSGATEGQGVLALVTGSTVSCGSGQVINDGGLKFVVRVRPESARAGCGAPGKNVQLFFSATSASPGRFATTSTPWTVGPKQVTITLGDPLPVRGRAPYVASDGVAGS